MLVPIEKIHQVYWDKSCGEMLRDKRVKQHLSRTDLCEEMANIGINCHINTLRKLETDINSKYARADLIYGFSKVLNFDFLNI